MSRPSRAISGASFIILLIAAVLRLAALGQIPPGLPYEEAALAGQALHPPTLLSPGSGQQLITYLMSGSLALFGPNLLGIRMAAVLCGMLTVVFTYRWVRLLYSRRVALLAAGLLAASFWPLYFSRIGLGAVTLPPLLALANWLFARGLARGSRVWLGLAGIAVGAALYSPPGGWLAPAVFGGLYLWLAIARRDALRASPIGHTAFWAAAILVGLPLVIAQRGVTITPQMSALADSLAKSDTGPLLDALGRSVGMWAALGDGLFHYNVGFWPVFNIGLAIVFVVGLFHPVREQARPDEYDYTIGMARALVPAWLAAGVIAAALIDPERPFTMGIIALPSTYIVLALGFEMIGRLIGASAGAGRVARNWGGIVAAIVLLAGVEGTWSYFAVGPNDPQAQSDYRTDLFMLARDLRSNPTGGSVAISTNPPDNIPPLVFEFLPHGDRPIRWFDASTGLIIPPAADGKTAEVDIPDVVQVQPRLLSYLRQQLPSVPGIHRYQPAYSEIFTLPPNFPVQSAPEIVFGNTLSLVSHESDKSRQAGKPVRVTLIWYVKRDMIDPSPDLAMFAHLLNPDGTLAAQSDVLAAPSSAWRYGDVLIQTEDIPTPKKLKPGSYQLEIGLYERASGKRLQVIVYSQDVGDRLLLEPVEIKAP